MENIKKLGLAVQERLGKITSHEIGSHIIIKPYSKKKKTALFYDVSTEQYMKCTVSIGLVSISISNIRTEQKGGSHE
jgi:prolyl-tRNA editing enzyme YbaK/EbsC (Cys-tRNA(Pro) deacylase)